MSNISMNLKIFKSRNIILEQLERRGFDISEYSNFSLNEIHVLHTNDQLDMLLSTTPEGETKTEGIKEKKVYIKYHLSGKLTKSNIYDYIEDLHNIEDEEGITTLNDEDDLIIIIKDKVNQPLINFIKQLYHKDKKFIPIFNINRYLFNILDHVTVPTHIKLSEVEKEEAAKEFNIMNDNQWPEISMIDPVAQAIGLRPDDLCKIIRTSPTASQTIYYRLCI